ncbi:acyl-CoA reductase [Flavobacterium sp. CS20]|uniref:acyl-CoA reductase n=1 Tax=Flavobacterium sp. CS20 TaxID=2775246 RepID=UPI001B3A3F16|nr:acyl-CoA reductase [Flavobacterium sp. CS20]QTY28127.1 acyl-CoA reductase [Flavobacterium sp. CS20]
MLTFEQRKATFVDLGQHIRDLTNQQSLTLSKKHPKFEEVLQIAKAENRWFTEENICFALQQWGKSLQKNNLDEWLNPYNLEKDISPQNIGVVMAGNIPLVGFHDFLSTLISGHNIIAKLSSNDKQLLPYFAEQLVDIQPEFKSYIKFEENQLKNYDAVIATGSNNTARYFEYYFRNKPHIIRKNRNGVAVLTNQENIEDFQKLGEDMFRFFGLGCRNVSKLFIPQNFNFNHFFKGISKFKPYIYHNKYANNYDYNKAVYLMSDTKFLDNDFLILKEDKSIASPIGVVHYEIYDSETSLQQTLNQHRDEIQCIVGQHSSCQFDFGQAQQPNLADYADGIDTVQFLQNLSTK